MQKTFNKIVVFSGAGISQESGIKTFRDSGGLWENHKIEDVCNMHTWKDNYDLVHKFYDDRREQLGTVSPNLAHTIISEWQKKYLCLNVTTNVDDLFEKAGVVDTVHLHGFLPEVYCIECGMKYNMQYERLYNNGTINPIVNTIRSHKHDCIWQSFSEEEKHNIQKCKIYKPNVVFFNETAPMYSTYNSILNSIDNKTIAIVVGASNIVVNFISDLYTNTNCKILVVDTNKNILDDYQYENVELYNTKASEGLYKINELLTNYMEV